MKFKKIISMIAAATMLSSVFVANAYAEINKDNPVVMDLNYSEYDLSADKNFKKFATKYDGYEISVDIKNAPSTYDPDAMNGYGIVFVQFQLESETSYSAKKNTGDWWIDGGVSGDAANKFALQVSSPDSPLYFDAAKEGDDLTAVTSAILLVKKGTTMKLVPSSPIVTVLPFENDVAGETSQAIEYIGDTIKYGTETAKGFQIGTPAPAAKLDKVVISGATATTLTVGDEVTLTAKAYNDDETEKAAAIAWTVEGDAVTVADGLVKAVKEGTATVTATAVDGEITKSASVTFTVEAEKLPALPEVTVAGGDVAGQEVKSGENTIGYLWKAIFNAATIKDKYIATFKSGAETNAATLKGFAAHNIEGEGNVSVIVALNTAKAAVTLGITE